MEGAAQSVVSNVGQLVAKEFWLLRGVGSEVVELRDELATMNALLLMQSEAGEGGVDHVVREWMKQVRELACDADDCVDLYIFRIKRRPSDGFLVKSKRLLATLFPRRLLAGDIRALRSRAIAISERHARYSSSRTVYLSQLAPDPAVTDLSTQRLRPGRADANDPDDFVGVEELNTVIDMVEGEKDDGKLKVFSIVGLGGLGKTTLAFEVCRQVKTKFQCQAQVSVSRAFDSSKDLRGLLKRVLQQILQVNDKGIETEKVYSVGNIDAMDVEMLTKKLKEHLQGKRYLIVLDDVSTVAVWAAIRSKLPESTCGSIIIVTTQLDSVAQACSGASVCEDHIYHMKPLNREDSEKLYVRRVLGIMEGGPRGDSIHNYLNDEINQMLRRCGGHPLAIVCIGGLWASHSWRDSTVMWGDICRSIGSSMDTYPTPAVTRKIAVLSFNYLSRELKRCMMYLSIFPEDYLISKIRLLKRWIVEGLIPEKQGLTLMETAEAYYNELVNRGMIDQAGCIVTYCNRVDMCRVHDIMLDVMVSKSLEANFVSLVGTQYDGMSYDIVRRLSIHGADGGNQYYRSRKMVNGIEGMNVQHVRSLSTFRSEGHKLLLDQLGMFKLLRVLDLEDCKDLKNKHLRYICKMYLLKFLSLRGTDVSMMPREVCDLEHLQILDVGDTLLDTLPKTMIKLIKLERLMFSNRERLLTLWILPKGISKMKALREVSRVAIENIEVAIEIGDLQQLEQIFVYVNTNVHNNDMDYHPLLDLDMPPQLLRYLSFGGFIPRIPDWVGSLAFLAEFTISGTKLVGNQPFEVLCKARNLNHITFQMDFYIDRDLVACSAHKFSSLKSVRVIAAAETPEMFSFEEDSMTPLEILEVDFGDWQKSIAGIEHLKNLKLVRLSGSSNNASLMEVAEKLKEESDRRGKSDDNNQRPFTVGVRYN
ncbi:disease resistance protein Pik-2-like [Triticum aestivum]|uniref:disease resistance protein Pik-2-like n=1 Tax=Triticum aestivum TaxID=4565 RepID=UPI001D01CD74|nr:disease resistance protein Pik-2-like [Triticum aestivum]